MINKTTVNIYIVLFTIFAAASCTKLDLKPTDVIDPSKAFRNVSDVNMGLIGVYALVDYDQISLNSTVSDEAMYPTENTVGNSDAFRWLYTPSSGSVTSFYYTGYTAIDRVNRTLEGLEKLTISNADAPLANQYKGELLALRAYFHFELLRAYASAYESGAMGVPYMKASAIGYPARDNFEVVIADAKADLSAAKDLIPASFNDKTRITRAAVAALQARIALYEKKWSEAVTYANEVIDAQPLASKSQFPGIWTDANDNEVIWKAKRVGTTGSRVGGFYYREQGGIVLYAPAFKLIHLFDTTNDVRAKAYITYDPSRTGLKSKYRVSKYIGGTASAPGLTDIKLFRTGEVYLIKAEAQAEGSNWADGAATLNALRAQRIRNYTNAAFAGKEALITAIMEERFKELAFEGHRFYDLRRRGLSVQRLPEDAVNASGAVTLAPTAAQYAFPVPATEVLINKATKQNPGY
ncbi:hypothetical protein A8C56_18635 [Niabella ginsenosidivorans]|uniref:Carbohydrate-binding protein SusD n=1 Tax=Niabella ginsenosidivorans TaxID=1176587 RepID=A0A1A9I7T4_9BACT|nr:RagB/SusD family nutrient uptake outer membrane protein [Niabella ginsenosidivorans]ANH82722.1 hypothetical protein A8C56_18635 [Niabella ginsenosidivorans]